MKTKLFRVFALAVIGASFIGVSSVASAGGWENRHDREIHRAECRIDDLRVAKDRAADHHDWRAVRRIERDIDRQQDIIRHERRELERERDRDRHWDRDRDWHRG